MIRKLLNKWSEFKFNSTIKPIQKSPPIDYIEDASVTIVSMVSTTTVNMYLVAIKSFMKHFGRGTIEIINDGTLTGTDLSTLKNHIPGVRITNASDVETFDSPSYISWKRLYRIQQIAETSYVIQLDSDTLSLGPLVEVDSAARENKGFVIGSKRWAKGVNVKTLHAIVRNWKSSHVQALAEENFHNLDFFKDDTLYLRGCAGFAGYPKNFATIEDIRKLSNDIRRYVGEEWMKWGSEQTTTLCLISKTPNASILDWPTYQNFDFPKTNENIESINFVHFIGSNRFNGGLYTKLSYKFLNTVMG